MLADKGTGLRSLCQVLGVDLSEVMAFGDNDNDLPMLELAGRPYVMEKASPKLKERFSCRCASVAIRTGGLVCQGYGAGQTAVWKVRRITSCCCSRERRWKFTA